MGALGRAGGIALLAAAAVSALPSSVARAEATPQQRFERARQAAVAGDFTAARERYAGLMREEPDNVDHVFGYAQVLHWSGDDLAALRYLVLARKLAPDYEDVWILEARIRTRNSERIATVETAAFRDAAAQRFPDAAWAQLPPAEDTGRHAWTVAAGWDRLDNDTPDWERLRLSVDLALGARTHMTLIGEHSERFDDSDVRFGVGAARELNADWSLETRYLTSRTSAYLPKRDLMLGIARKAGNGWVLHTRLQGRRYAAVGVDSAAVGVERYAGAYRFEYVLGIAELESDRATTHRIGAQRYTDSGSAYGLTIAAGEEIESVAAGQVLRTDIRSLTISGKHPLTAGLAIGWLLGVHDQGDFYRRTGFGAWVSGAF